MSKLIKILTLCFLSLNLLFYSAFGQICTSNPTSLIADTDFSNINWTSTDGAICPPSNPFSGDITIELANGVDVNMDFDITIEGDFILTAQGSDSKMIVPSGITIHVKGDLGSPDNNNVTYSVNGVLIVDGTLFGKNNNAFEGTGSISGGSLDVKNGAGCGDPCPVSGGFSSCTSDDGFCDSYNVLPVELLSFEAFPGSEGVELNWTTASEENFSHFLIDRSSNAVKFEKIGQIKGKGSGKSIVNYSFTDNLPIDGKSYYRLSAVDKDGTIETFDVISVNFNIQKAEVLLFPNPVSAGNSIKLKVNTFSIAGLNMIKIYDQLGNLVMETNIKDSVLEFSLPENLKKGVYMVHYFTGNINTKSRLLIN